MKIHSYIQNDALERVIVVGEHRRGIRKVHVAANEKRKIVQIYMAHSFHHKLGYPPLTRLPSNGNLKRYAAVRVTHLV